MLSTYLTSPPAKTIAYEEEDEIVAPFPSTNIASFTDKSSTVKSTVKNSPSSIRKRIVEADVVGQEEEVATDDQYDGGVESKRGSLKRKGEALSEEKSSQRRVLQKNLDKSEEPSKGKKKAYYPMIELMPRHFEHTASSKEERESVILKRVVNEACALEQQGLRSYFETKYPDKMILLHGLENILENLPKYLDLQISDDVSFKSEYTSSEKTQLFEMRTIVENQKSLYANLLKYEEDPQLFLTDHGISIVKDQVNQADATDPVRFSNKRDI